MLNPGTELAGYRIERLIARGGMGEVYEAVQLSLERRVALKLISEPLGLDESFRARFRREARSAASIDHPNILPVYEAGELPDGRLFLAMRLVKGPDLNSLVQERGPLEPGEAVGILVQVGVALDAAHEHGLVHRDVKPANVMLEPTTPGWHAYLTDFGLAKPHSGEAVSQHTAEGVVLGTIDYMAPEQIAGERTDGRADVYSFGCAVYYCLTGGVPFKRDTLAATLMAHASAPIPLPSAVNPAVPRPLDLVVQRAMEKDPEKRARSAGALMRWAASQLDAPAPASVTVERPTDRNQVTPPVEPAGDDSPGRRRRPFWWLVGAGVLAIAVLAAVLALGGNGPNRPAGVPVARKSKSNTGATTPTTPTGPTTSSPGATTSTSTTQPTTVLGPPLGPPLSPAQLTASLVPTSAYSRDLPGFYPGLSQDTTNYALHGGIPKLDLCGSHTVPTPGQGLGSGNSEDSIPYGVRPTIFFGSYVDNFAGQGAARYLDAVASAGTVCGWQTLSVPTLDDKTLFLTKDLPGPDDQALHNDLVFVRDKGDVLEVATALAGPNNQTQTYALARIGAQRLARAVATA